MALTGWDSAKKFSFTVPVANVPSDEVDFPILLNISAASGLSALDLTAIFTELGANSLKIAVEDGDTGNQCYIEIERWDAVALSAQLHVKKPALSSTVDPVVNFYYDSTVADNTTYVGVTTTVPAQNVWTNGYAAVYHMSQDPSGTAPQILDSTANANHGTTYGTMTSSQLVDGLVGKAISFDGVDDYIDIGNSASITVLGSVGFTLEYSIIGFGTGYNCLSANGDTGGYMIRTSGGNILFISASGAGYNTNTGVIDAAAYNNVVFAQLGTGVDVYANGAFFQTLASVPEVATTTTNTRIALRPSGADIYDGIMDEVRFSNVKRSAGWIACTNLSNRDQFGTWLFVGTVAVDLTSTNIITGLPLISNSVVGQIHILASTNIITGLPLISNPVVTSGIVYNFTSLDILTGIPLISSPIISQLNKLIANNILSGSPLISNPVVTVYFKPPDYVINSLIFEKGANSLIFEKGANSLIFEKGV